MLLMHLVRHHLGGIMVGLWLSFAVIRIISSRHLLKLVILHLHLHLLMGVRVTSLDVWRGKLHLLMHLVITVAPWINAVVHQVQSAWRCVCCGSCEIAVKKVHLVFKFLFLVCGLLVFQFFVGFR